MLSFILLILGYLRDLNDELSCSFLQLSPYLMECRELYDEGADFVTTFSGMTLKELLQEYVTILFIVDSTIRSAEVNEKASLEKSKLSEKLCALLKCPLPGVTRSRASSLTTASHSRNRRATNPQCLEQQPSDAGSVLLAASRTISQENLKPTSDPDKNVGAWSQRTGDKMEVCLQQPELRRSHTMSRRRGDPDDQLHESSGGTRAQPDLLAPSQEPTTHPLSTEPVKSPGSDPQAAGTSSTGAASPSPYTVPQLADTGAASSSPCAVLQTAGACPSGAVSPSKSSCEQMSDDPLEGPEVSVGGSAESPRIRRGVDKETFFSNIELERDGQEIGSSSSGLGKLKRSGSCNDLSLESQGGEKRRLRGKPRFFTPNKRRSEEPSETAIKATLRELYRDRELHEQLARSINQAREEVTLPPEADELDQAIQVIIDKTTADPAFNDIMNQTLTSFDLLAFLKPSAKPVISVKERIRNAAPRNKSEIDSAKQRRCRTSKSKEKETDQSNGAEKTSSALTEIETSAILEASITTAELVPYPEIHYDPADCNILTGALDSDGNNCLFYSDPRVNTPGIALPPAPTPTQDAPRYRNILPKFNQVTLSDLHPVVVCTPMMAPPPPPPPVPAAVASKKRAARGKAKKKKGPKEKTKAEENQEPEIPHKIIAPTPGRVYNDDMPAINFFATPQPPSEPAPPAEPSPPPVPAVTTPDAPPQTRRQSLSTPRRKSYIRALEFETPQKEAENKKSATSPKSRGPPSAGTTPVSKDRSASKVKTKVMVKSAKVSVIETGDVGDASPKRTRFAEKVTDRSSSVPPIATRTPVKNKLSEAWDALTGISCVLGNTSHLEASTAEIAVETSDTTEEKTISVSSVSASDVSKLCNETTVVTNSPSNALRTWDSNLRLHLSETEFEHRKDTPSTRPPKRCRKITKKVKKKKLKPKKSPKAKRKSSGTTSPPTRRITRSKTITISPSKMNVTSKRSTYSISHGSSSAFDSSSSTEEMSTLVEVVDSCSRQGDLVEMTPAKEEVNTAEETPFTKLLRENVTTVDIDLSMIQTPCFPETPCIFPEPVTPFHATRGTDYSSGSSYYKPELTSPASCLKDLPLETVEELQISEECLQDVSTVSGRNLVYSPEKNENAPSKQNKITDYYKVNESRGEVMDEPARMMEKQPADPVERNEERTRVVNPQSAETENVVGSKPESRDGSKEGCYVNNSEETTIIVDVHERVDIHERVDVHERVETIVASAAKQTKIVETAKKKTDMNVGPKGAVGTKAVSVKKVGDKPTGSRRKPARAGSPREKDNKKTENPKSSKSAPKSSRAPGTTKTVEVRKQSEDKHNRKRVSSETRIIEIVNEGKKIMNTKRVIPGKNMSFLKLQMIAECDIKLSENIPIAESPVRLREVETAQPVAATTMETEAEKPQNTLLLELEKKRRHVVQKMKESEVKQSAGLKRTKKPLERPIKRNKVTTKAAEDVFAGPLVSSTPNKPTTHTQFSKVTVRTNCSPRTSSSPQESPVLPPGVPPAASPFKIQGQTAKTSEISGSPGTSNVTPKNPRLSEEISEDVRKEIPPFTDDGEFPELNINTKKKLFVIKAILNRQEVIEYLGNYAKTPGLKIILKPCIRKLFKTLFNWLKHPHKHELGGSPLLREKISFYLESFKKVNEGVPYKKKTPPTSLLSTLYQEYKNSGDYSSDCGSSIDSNVGQKWKKSRRKVTKKEKNRGGSEDKARDKEKEEAPLPFKKRKNPPDDTAVTIEAASETPKTPAGAPENSTRGETTSTTTELAVVLPNETANIADSKIEANNESSVTHAQSILQDIDVDQFLSHVHGHDSS